MTCDVTGYKARCVLAAVTYCKLIVELISEEGVREFSEVSFQQRTDAVYVLHVLVTVQVWCLLLVKIVSSQ